MIFYKSVHFHLIAVRRPNGSCVHLNNLLGFNLSWIHLCSDTVLCCKMMEIILTFVRHAVVQWLRHCATNRKVAGSIPDGVRIFH
jgi:hypothetical protein